MWKLRLRYFLPVVQFLFALGTLYSSTHEKLPSGSDDPFASPVTLICFGINAPALLLRALGAWLGMPRIDHAPVVVFGLGLGEGFFLLGVIACWYSVGRWLDNRASPEIERKSEISRVGSLLFNLSVTALGIFLFGLAIYSRQTHFSSTAAIVEKAFLLAWSVFLICVPSMKLLHWFRKSAST